MSDEEINYRVLRKIQQYEQKSPNLGELKNEFFDELTEYIQNLEKRLITESSDQKKKLLKEEISNIKRLAINIYEIREKKIILASISKIRGGNPPITNMLNCEKEMFGSIFKIINESRNKFLKKDSKSVETKEKNSKSSINLQEKKQEEDSNINQNNKSAVRLKQDLPEFIGTDTKKYILKKDDILTLSEEMSKMLEKRDAVEKLEI